jgi:hypothetical protein
MKKLLLLVLLTVTTALHAQQPPVFDKSNTSFVADQQVTVGVEMNSNNWNSLLESTVPIWDLSQFMLTSNFRSYDFVNSTNPLYPNTISIEFSEQSTPTTVVDRTSYYKADDTGMHEVATSFSEQRYPIGQFTGNVMDTFYLLNQQYEYVTPRTIMKFPCTMNSAWGSGYSLDFNTELTITNFGLNRAPFVRNTVVAQYDSVVGWGQMRIPMADGKRSASYPVLVVSRSTIVRHLYTLNGQPAPPTLLGAFELTQNDSSASTSSLLFWRAAQQTPLVHVSFSGISMELDKYISTMVDTKNLTADGATSVRESAITVANVSPNPVTGAHVTVNIEGHFTGGEIALYNAYGQRIELPPFFMIGTQQLTLNVEDLSTGAYTLHLSDNSGSMMSAPFVVVR